MCSLVGQIQTHASTINDMNTLKNSVLIDNSDLNIQQDLYFEDISLKKNDLNINSDGASIKDLNSETTVFTFLGNVEIISEIMIIKCIPSSGSRAENRPNTAPGCLPTGLSPEPPHCRGSPHQWKNPPKQATLIPKAPRSP